MRKNNCEVIRRELDELMLDEACSASVVEHLKECLACREFHQTQTKLRQMVGSLGTVTAPADFDFRLRARLANDSSSTAFHFWSFARRGLAVAGVLIVFATGIIVVRNVVNQQTGTEVAADKNLPVPKDSSKPVNTMTPEVPAPARELTAGVQENSTQKIKSERPQTGSKIKRPLSTVERASERAGVLKGMSQGDSGATAVIPIDASLQSLRFSFDDGRGNARTVSVPAIRFGSQRMLSNGNQFAQKGIW
jgi:hypothetical protein